MELLRQLLRQYIEVQESAHQHVANARIKVMNLGNADKMTNSLLAN